MAHSIPQTAMMAMDAPHVRHIRIADLREAMARGVDDFLATPTQLFFLALIYPIVGLAAARIAWGGDMFHLIYPLIVGFALLGPVGAVGLYEISRRREQGHETTWLDALAVFRSPALLSVLAMGVVLLAIAGLWLLTAQAIYGAAFPQANHASFGGLLRDVADTPDGHWMILVGNGAGLLFGLVVLTISVVSFPMILDRGVGPVVAMRTSIRAVLASPVAMLAWGVIVLGGLLLGCIPLFVGLAVTMPLLGHTTWHLYRKMVV